MTPRPTPRPAPQPAPVLRAEIPVEYVPTPEDLAEMAEYYARLAEPLDECPCCGDLIRVGDDSERLGDRYICRACARWLDEQEESR